MDRVLSVDVPQLMNAFPTERQDAAEAAGVAPTVRCCYHSVNCINYISCSQLLEIRLHLLVKGIRQ
jgi:hypothetical protein